MAVRATLDDRGTVAPRVRTARWAVAAMFLVNGALLANWVARIPAVQQRLGLSAGALGIALLGMAIGALAAFPVTGLLIAHYGSRRVTTGAALVYCAAVPLPGLAPSLPLLMVALIALGAGNGAMDVAMNAQGVAVEARYGRPIMSSFHGLWSVGGFAGALVGGVAAGAGIAPFPHLLGAAVVLVIAALIASRWLLPVAADAHSGAPAFARPTRALLGLGVVAFCSALGEGAMADWSAVYLHTSLATSAAFAAAGYAGFSLAMTAGRLSGDRLTHRFGPVVLVRAGGLLAAVGLGVALVVGRAGPAVAGFALVGAGLSLVAPLVYSRAGRTPGVSAAAALAAVATMGYTGFLLGPPIIGAVAQALSLRDALGIIVLLGLAIAALARNVGPPA
jgi:MFS family permease